MKRLALALALTLGLLAIFPAQSVAELSHIRRSRVVVISGNPAVGNRVADVAQREYWRLGKLFRYSPVRPIRLYVYADEREFRSTGISPEAVGEASPERLLIRLLGTTPNLPMVVRHELVHVFFLGSLHHPQKVPFWFSEGLAIYLSRPGVTAAEYERLALTGKLPSINSSYLRHHQTSKSSAGGYLIVRFIAQRWGEGKVFEIVKRLQDGQELEPAVQGSLGVGISELDKLWSRYGASRQADMRWSLLTSTDWILIGLVSISVSLVWLAGRIRGLAEKHALKIRRF